MEDYVTELACAKRAAREAGKILMDRYGKVKARYKRDRSLVTEADVASEARIKEILKEEFPDHSFLAEESGFEDNGSDHTWVIDPLDGTTNYSFMNPFFNVSIGLSRGNDPVLGVVYSPFQDELFHAVKGNGAYMNEERIHVSGVSNLEDSLVCFCHAPDRDSIERVGKLFTRLKLISDKTRQVGAAALELSYVACGRAEVFFVLKHKPWDVAAGAVIVTEAGGTVTDINGKNFNLDSIDIVASNGLVHDRLLELLSKD